MSLSRGRLGELRPTGRRFDLLGIVAAVRRGGNRLGRWAMPLRVATTAVLLVIVCVRSEAWNLPAQLRQANVLLVVAMLACSYLVWAVNTYRWQLILAGFDVRHGMAELFRLNLAGQFYGLVLPGQVSGEVLKAMRLARRSDQRHVVYVSVLLDRVYGVIGLGLLGCAALMLAPPPGWMGQKPGIAVLAGMALVGLGVLVFPRFADRLRLGRQAPFGSALARVRGVLIGLTTPNGQKLSAGSLTMGCVLGVLSQALTAGIHFGIATSLGLAVSPLVLVWVLAMVTIVSMLPISLAGFGVREATYVGLLSLVGVSSNAALSFSLILFVTAFALALTGGLLDLVVGRLSPDPALPG